LTADQVAQVLAVSPHTVRRMADAGDLERVHIGPAGRLVRFRSTDVEALIGPVNDERPADNGALGTTSDHGTVRDANGTSG
jgi:excisionase family DNA binding protein